MIRMALIFLAISIIAGLFGFKFIAGATKLIAKIIFFIFLVLFIVFVILAF